MNQPTWIKEAMAAGDKFHLKNINHFRHNTINLMSLGFLIALFLSIVYLSLYLSAWIYIPLAAFGFGWIFNSFIILLAHEASHNMFVLTKNRQQTLFWNRIFGWFGCIPIGMDYKNFWEIGHLTHHKITSEPEDPNVCDPKTGKNLLTRGAKVLLIPGYTLFLGAISGWGVEFDCPRGEKREIFWRGIFSAIIFYGIIVYFRNLVGIHSISVTIAILLCFNVTGFLQLLTLTFQHGSPATDEPNIALRSMTVFMPFLNVVFPFNFNYHFEHHLYLMIPWYRLRKYHRELKKIIPLELQPYIFVKKPFKQMIGVRVGVPENLKPLTLG